MDKIIVAVAGFLIGCGGGAAQNDVPPGRYLLESTLTFCPIQFWMPLEIPSSYGDSVVIDASGANIPWSDDEASGFFNFDADPQIECQSFGVDGPCHVVFGHPSGVHEHDELIVFFTITHPSGEGCDITATYRRSIGD